MSIMDELKLPEEIRTAIVDWFTAEELVAFLDVSTEDIVDALEDEILNNYEDVLEEIRWNEQEEFENDEG